MYFITKLAYLRKWRIAREIMAIYGVEVPPQVKIGKEFEIIHRGFGTVIHPNTIIGDRVKIYHQVTIGRADAHVPFVQSKMLEIIIEDDVVIFPGAKVLARNGKTIIGKGTIVAANAVLINSTGPGEIWAGVPARLIGKRDEFSYDNPE